MKQDEKRQTIQQQLAALAGMGPAALRQRFQEVFGEPARTGNKQFLYERLAWRLQSLAEGGLSERAGRRAEELARDADLRTTAPKVPRCRPARPCAGPLRHGLGRKAACRSPARC